ncbi:MAG: hypothetical protein ACFFEA_10025, partial [Candidatus Thorarchaeota archaeon]
MQKGTYGSSSRMHPVVALISRVPMKISYAMILVGVLTYAGFLLLALLTGLTTQVFFSFMHLVQLDFSLLITVGLFFLYSYYRTLDKRLREIRYVFLIDDDEYEIYLENLTNKMSSARGFLFGLPFIALAIASIFLFVMPTMPNPLFPVAPLSPIWLYMSIIEFGFIMLPLFGVAIWLGVVVMSVSKDIG